MKKMKKIFVSLMVLVVIASSFALPAFAYTATSLYLNNGCYNLNANDNCQLYFTKSKNINATFDAYNSSGNYYYVRYTLEKIAGLDVDNFSASKTLISSQDYNVSTNNYSGTVAFTLPDFGSFESQAVYEIRATAYGNEQTSQFIRVVYCKRDFSVVNIHKYLPVGFNGGEFTLTADVYDLNSVGIKKVTAGCSKSPYPSTYYSTTTNVTPESTYKYGLSCTLSTSNWNEYQGTYSSTFLIQNSVSGTLTSIFGDKFTIN